jgi:hypothetical protein
MIVIRRLLEKARDYSNYGAVFQRGNYSIFTVISNRKENPLYRVEYPLYRVE